MKHWFQSRTIWYNAVTALAVVVAVLGQYGLAPNQEAVNTAVELNTLLAPFINIYLRKITTTGIQ